jgi:hypothetical protein
MDIFRAAAANRQGTIEDRAPHRATRDSLITLIILGQLLRLHLIPFRPLEIAVFIRAISQAHLAIAKADAQLLALQRAKDAGRGARPPELRGASWPPSQPATARSSWRCRDNAVPVGLGAGAAGCMVAHQDLAGPRASATATTSMAGTPLRQSPLGGG